MRKEGSHFAQLSRSSSCLKIRNKNDKKTNLFIFDTRYINLKERSLYQEQDTCFLLKLICWFADSIKIFCFNILCVAAMFATCERGKEECFISSDFSLLFSSPSFSSLSTFFLFSTIVYTIFPFSLQLRKTTRQNRRVVKLRHNQDSLCN